MKQRGLQSQALFHIHAKGSLGAGVVKKTSLVSLFSSSPLLLWSFFLFFLLTLHSLFSLSSFPSFTTPFFLRLHYFTPSSFISPLPPLWFYTEKYKHYGFLPLSNSLEYEGLYNEFYFDIGLETEKIFSPKYRYDEKECRILILAWKLKRFSLINIDLKL